MARTKAEAPATKAKARSSGHPAKAFRKVIAPDASKGSKGSGTSCGLDDRASDSEEDTDEDSSGSETDTAEDATGTGSTVSAAADDSGDRDASSSPDGDASGTEENTDDSSSSSSDMDASEDSTDTESSASRASDCDNGCTAACLAETAHLRKVCPLCARELAAFFNSADADRPGILRGLRA